MVSPRMSRPPAIIGEASLVLIVTGMVTWCSLPLSLLSFWLHVLRLLLRLLLVMDWRSLWRLLLKELAVDFTFSRGVLLGLLLQQFKLDFKC